jgi:hypothetical protein
MAIGIGIRMMRTSVITPKIAVDWNNVERLIHVVSSIVRSQSALMGSQANMALKKIPVLEPTLRKIAAQVAHLNHACWF